MQTQPSTARRIGGLAPAAPSNPTGNRRFIALDSWRGACALLVAVHNLNFGTWTPQSTFVAHSWLFVDFFFVLSGFVMTYAYGDRLATARDRAAFVVRRVGRLWPLHVAVLAMLVGVSLLRPVAARMLLPSPLALPALADDSMRTIAANLLLVQSFDHPSRLTWNTPSWSISTELWTYFLFAVICSLFAGRRPPLIVMMGAVTISGCALALLSADYLATNTDYAFFRCVYGFFVGHLVYRAWESGPLWRWGGMLEFAAVALVIGFVFVVDNDALSMTAPVIFGFAVWVFAQEQGRLSTFLKRRPFVWLGTWSYSIYMVHWPVRNILVRADPFLERAVQGWMVDALLVGYLIVVITLAATTYRMVEQPARKLFNRMADSILAGSARD